MNEASDREIERHDIAGAFRLSACTTQYAQVHLGYGQQFMRLRLALDLVTFYSAAV